MKPVKKKKNPIIYLKSDNKKLLKLTYKCTYSGWSKQTMTRQWIDGKVVSKRHLVFNKKVGFYSYSCHIKDMGNSLKLVYFLCLGLSIDPHFIYAVFTQHTSDFVFHTVFSIDETKCAVQTVLSVSGVSASVAIVIMWTSAQCQTTFSYNWK